jgi:transcriptional regulator with XRE-family HTH domain
MTKAISPIGDTAEQGAARRRARSATYREQQARLVPYRVISHAVIVARAGKGMTQKDLAKAIGTTDSAISRIESGTRPVSLETLMKLGTALDITFCVGAAESEAVVVVPERAIEAETSRKRSRATSSSTSHPAPAFAEGR